jgi:3-hydroxyisobutyrate dehydrogenase-like beta-hydroxyacid dehydrogenase
MGDNGILAGANKDKILITNATLSIPWVDKLAGINKQKGFQFLDMPMTGGRIGAENGQLVLLTGGAKGILTELETDIKAIATKVIYFGKAGSGMRYKLILNMLQGIHMAAFGEVLSLAKEMGLDIKMVGNALAERPGGTTTNFAWRNFQNQPDPINFSVDWITKDLRYAQKAASKSKTPLLDQTLKKYNKAVLKGLGKKDWTVINIDRT